MRKEGHLLACLTAGAHFGLESSDSIGKYPFSGHCLTLEGSHQLFHLITHGLRDPKLLYLAWSHVL
jgi:hypothetical protein